MNSRSKNHIINYLNIPDLLTLMNAVCGILSIFFAIDGRLITAMLLLIGSGLFDLFDGKLARKMNITTEFGKQLDSFSDLVSFIIAPAVIAYVMLDDIALLKMLVLLYFIVSGILRLARYNVSGLIEDNKAFEGMPVPFSLVILVLFLWAVQTGIYHQIAVLLFFAQGILMTSVLKVKKP
ncbi:MAG: CDP-diacylglycerol--serine O-phosphatidyltransferase [Mucilaginibacter sp.]|nr:CDP-diacylglycerol--serine O-phosphatidyltransferase [Mucilaginibacter sp.]